jgi:uncharacterized protein (TIGR00255 family)
MLRSMTGFGSAAGEAAGVSFAVEVRSVNNRYFKPVVRLAEGLSGMEADVDKFLRSRLTRGTVTLAVRMKLPEELAAYGVNSGVLQRYLEQLRPLEVDANPTLRIDLGSMLQLPGVCEPPEVADLVERVRGGLMGLLTTAVDDLVAMREAEGGALKADLESQCGAIASHLDAVAARAPLVVREYHERLAARVRELTDAGNVKLDEADLAREVAVFAERCDISEEVVRLRGHLEQFGEALGSPEPAGRKLDFIAQEMLREANTIASKAGDADIARAVVEIKTAIDRIKEQVQNVE